MKRKVKTPVLPVTEKLPGALEIDARRGVVYFHTLEGACRLRLEGLPREVLEGERQIEVELADLSRMYQKAAGEWDFRARVR